MPWSPIPKFPEIIKSLKKAGYTSEVTFEPLKTEIMRITFLMRDDAIKNTIKAMERLGFLYLKGDGVWEIKD